MASELDRQRLRGNVLDEVDALKRELREMKEQMATADQQGVIRGAGLLLRVRANAPAAPRPGFVVIYAQDEGDVTYLRVMDALGTARDLTNWSENGMDARLRDVVTGGWWRVYIDTPATGVPSIVYEEI